MKSTVELSIAKNSEHQHQYHSCMDPECQICNGVLAYCEVCREGEGGLTYSCPQRTLTDEEKEKHSQGVLDFIDGEWVELPYRTQYFIMGSLTSLASSVNKGKVNHFVWFDEGTFKGCRFDFKESLKDIGAFRLTHEHAVLISNAIRKMEHGAAIELQGSFTEAKGRMALRNFLDQCVQESLHVSK